jgi:GntR family transcriptional regulator
MAIARPMYQQIAEDLRQQIDSGVLARGSRLPTELELGEQYGASRNTVREAVKRLVSLGLIETRPGQGTFVTVEVVPFVTVLTAGAGVGEGGATHLFQASAEHRKSRMTPPRVEVQTPLPEIAKRLRLPATTEIVSRHEQRYVVDDVPWSRQTSFYPMEFVASGAAGPLMAEDIEGGAPHYVAETIGLKQVGYGDWTIARNPGGSEPAFPRVTRDAAVLENLRAAFDQNKRSARVTVTVFPADCREFIVRVGRVSGPRSETDAGEAEWPQTGPLGLPVRPAA